MKRISYLCFFLSFICISGYSTGADSAKVKRFSIGISTAPATITFWQYSSQDVNTLRDRTNQNYFYPSYLSFQYELSSIFSFRCETGYKKEQFSFSKDFGYGSDGQASLDMDYKKEYFSVPVGIRFYPNNRGKTIRSGGFYIQLMNNFDFTVKENINYTLTETSTAGPYNTPFPPDWNLPVHKEFHTYKMRYDRLCPTLSIGHEIIKKQFAFFYAGLFEFSPTYHRKTTEPFYYYNFKFSLVNVGLSYSF